MKSLSYHVLKIIKTDKEIITARVTDNPYFPGLGKRDTITKAIDELRKFKNGISVTICRLRLINEYFPNTSLETLDKFAEVYKSKNSNYGNSVADPPVLIPKISPADAVLVRCSDKISRALNLIDGEQDKVGESLKDTISDLIIYLYIYEALLLKSQL